MKNNTQFTRLPGHIIRNELKLAVRDLTNLQESLERGNDLKIESINRLISDLKSIKSEARSFDCVEDMPVSYQ